MGLKLGGNRKFLVYLFIILGITLIAYWPSFFHVLRGETYTYFMDTMGDNSAISLIAHWYNYEKVRAFDPGDTLLFRPLLFTIVGVEKAYFGTSYTLWRVAALLMHMLAVLCLFRLLWKIKPSILALLATVLFSVSFALVNTILYEQVASYALFTALILTGFYYAYQAVETGEKSNLLIPLGCMLVACFFHESGILFAMLLTVYLWFSHEKLSLNWKHWNLAFWAIPLLYLAIYIPEKFVNPASGLGAELPNIVSRAGFAEGLLSAKPLAELWFSQAMLPAAFTVDPITNLRYYSAVTESTMLDLAQIPPMVQIIFNFAAATTLAVVFAFTKARKDALRTSGSFIVLLMLSLGVLILANSLFRAKSHGIDYLLNHNFNVYIWIPLFIALIYALITGLRQINNKHTKYLAIAFLVLITLNITKVGTLNYDIMIAEQPVRGYFASIDNFIELHQGEQDFSFKSTMDEPTQKDLEFTLWKVQSKERVFYDFSVPQVLYWEYWNEDNPKYNLHYNGNQLEVR